MTVQSRLETNNATCSWVVATTTLPRVTVLVAAWNEADNIEHFIQSFRNLSYPDRELVLCAGGNDGTFEKAASLADESVLVIEQKQGEGKQSALRKGFQRATGAIIVLTDSDCLLNQVALTRLIDPILRGEYWVTSGGCQPKQSQLTNPFVFYQYAMQFRWAPTLQQRRITKALHGRNCAVSRVALEDVGAFSEDVAIGTDSFLAKKFADHGYQIRFVPDSVVETEFPSSLLAYCRQRSRWRRNGITHSLGFRHYRRAVKAFLPPARGLAMLGLPLLSLRSHRYLLYGWSSLVVYSILVRAKYVRSLRKGYGTIPQSIYLRIPAYLAAEWGAPVLSLLQMLSPRARNQW